MVSTEADAEGRAVSAYTFEGCARTAGVVVRDHVGWRHLMLLEDLVQEEVDLCERLRAVQLAHADKQAARRDHEEPARRSAPALRVLVLLQSCALELELRPLRRVDLELAARCAEQCSGRAPGVSGPRAL